MEWKSSWAGLLWETEKMLPPSSLTIQQVKRAEDRRGAKVMNLPRASRNQILARYGLRRQRLLSIKG